MYKNLFIMLLFCCISMLLNAQTDQSRINQLDEISGGGHKQMIGKSLPPSEIKGSTFYADNWFRGKVLFRNGKEIDDLLLRFDIASGIIETRSGTKKMYYKGEDIRKFSWLNTYSGKLYFFKNCRGYRISDTELDGFFEMIVEDEISLFAHPIIKVKKPDYVEGLDVGSRDYEIRKKEDYYLAFNKELVELKKGKEFKYLKNEYPGLKEFIKSNDLSFKQRDDLIAITHYLNTINAAN